MQWDLIHCILALKDYTYIYTKLVQIMIEITSDLVCFISIWFQILFVITEQYTST